MVLVVAAFAVVTTFVSAEKRREVETAEVTVSVFKTVCASISGIEEPRGDSLSCKSTTVCTDLQGLTHLSRRWSRC